MSFKFDRRKLEQAIEKGMKEKLAPQVKRDQVDPLRDDLNRLAADPPEDSEETRRRVLEAYTKHHVQPNENIQRIIDAVQAGEQIPDIEIRVVPPRLR